LAVLRNIFFNLKVSLIERVYPNTKNLPYEAKLDFFRLRLYSLWLEIKSFFSNKWLFNPITLITFFISLVFNTLLYIPYLFIFYILIPYWVYNFIIYYIDISKVEIKAIPKHNPFLWSFSIKYTILHIIYLQTLFKARINSYALIYNLLKELQKLRNNNKTPKHKILINFFVNFTRLMFSIIFRLLTSMPKNVVIDSYVWSRNFKYIFIRRNLYKGNMYYFIKKTITNSLIKDTIYNNLFPKTYLRVYKTPQSIWNFNPNIINSLENYKCSTHDNDDFY